MDQLKMAERLPAYLPRKFQRIHLELTNRCNFSCAFCPDCIMTRPRGLMSETLACSALDQIADLALAEKVTFHVMGEPLLHPQLFSILDHAARCRLPVGLTTNGALLNPETVQQIAERDLHQIDISLQTPDAESFRATRGTRMDFEKYRARLLDLLAACRNRPEPPIFKIRIMSTRFADRLRKDRSIPDFMRTSAQLRATVLEWTEIVQQRLNIPVVQRDTLIRRIEKIGIYGWNVIEISPKIFIETYILTDWGNAFAGEEIVAASYGYCFGMRDHFAILYTGDVVLCCVDYDGRTSVGNLKDASLEEILRGPDLKRIARGFHRGRLVHPHCRYCLGSRTWLGSWVKPTASFLGLKLLKPFLYRKYKLFDEDCG
jgi:MoaA/NifB/PqqE/SkfB family radical SAM enzyme